jgi:UDP-N-acetyl-D-mannosaminuronic acid dehydrogenase
VESLNAGCLHIEENGLDELFAAARPNFAARTEPEEADVFIIAVPTPLDRSVMVSDLSYVRSAAEMIAPRLMEGNLVVLESTVPPGASENLVIPVLERSGVAIGQFLYAHCPERAIPGATLAEMVGNDRIIGGIDEASGRAAADLYRSICTGAFHMAGTRDAEFIKLIENTFRDVNIAFANEIAVLAEEFGIDAWNAIALANRHPRVNILSPGPGVGGHCIAVDPVFLTENAGSGRLIQTARQINDSMPNQVMSMVGEMLRGR